MRAVDLIQVQFNAIHNILHECTKDLTDTEWMTCVLPGTNAPGFICWHLVRTLDWAVQTSIRGIPEVSANEPWADWSELALAGIGAGIPDEQANEIARLIPRADLLAYADKVHATIQGWLSHLSDDDLDTIPDMEAHMAPYPDYQQPGFRAETDDLIGKPMWRLLASPCVGHQRGHLGELDLLKQILRRDV